MAAATQATLTVAQIQALTTSLQTLMTAAQADLTNMAVTRDQQAVARQVVAIAQTRILQYQALLSPQTARTYTVRAGDTLFGIAQTQLGSDQRYTDIQNANGLVFLALRVGQVLYLPAQ